MRSITGNEMGLQGKDEGNTDDVSGTPEPEPAEGDSTVPSETSPPQVLKSHHCIWLIMYNSLWKGRHPEYGR